MDVFNQVKLNKNINMKKPKYFLLGDGINTIETYGFESFLEFVEMGLVKKGQDYDTLKVTKVTTPEYILGAYDGYSVWNKITQEEYMAIKSAELC